MYGKDNCHWFIPNYTLDTSPIISDRNEKECCVNNQTRSDNQRR